jgi:large subunit ribosomal protein L32
MALPKEKHSKARTRKRKANWKAKKPSLVLCPQCHQPKQPHRVCPECGYYDGREVIAMEEEEE